jgi:hypothetical protein
MDRDKAIRWLAIAWVVLAVLSFVFGMGTVEVYVLTLLAAVIAVLWIGRPKRTGDPR